MPKEWPHRLRVSSTARIGNRCVLACTKSLSLIEPAQVVEQACILERSCRIATAYFVGQGLRRRVPPAGYPGYLSFEAPKFALRTDKIGANKLPFGRDARPLAQRTKGSMACPEIRSK